jgi:branched-chain amino acid transport system permease protein
VIVFYLLNRLFADYGTWYLVGLGLLAILVTTRFPRGVWGIVSVRLGLHLFPVQRRLVADVRHSSVSTQGGHSRRASRA